MSATDATSQLLRSGDKLTLDEFLRRWGAMPQLKKAELIEGVVDMPSPTKADHGDTDDDIAGWLVVYRANTPGTRSAGNATTVLGENSLQPDHSLRLLPEAGGRVSVEDGFLHGAPEFVVEVCSSSTSYDLSVKKDLYEQQQVGEYLALLIDEKEIRWHRWEDGGYRIVSADEDGMWRSSVFPGLWLDGKALLDGDLAKVMERLQRGLESPEHAEFVERLKNRIASKNVK